jgi:hypothetical protein
MEQLNGVFYRARGCATTNCVEVAQLAGGAVQVRDSKGTGSVQSYSGPEWAEFVKGVKAGEFDPQD